MDLGSFDFTPDWAKKDAKVTVGKDAARAASEPESRPARDARKPFDKRGDRPFARDARKPFDKRGGEARRFGDRPRFERPKPLDVEVKILPETKALGTIIRKLQGDSHAFKLKDLAYFFLDNPSSVLLKITPKKGADGAPAAGADFHQCKACGFASTRPEDVTEHILAAHLGDYYEAKEIEVEPPKGNFSCVAKCGLSGVLLGPPNVHEFAATVKEMIRTRYPDMSEADYRSRLVMVRDAEAIEEWRKSATKKTVYVQKGAGEGAAQLTRDQAEAEFRRTILPSMLDRPKNLMITADVAMKSPVRPLQWAAKDALEAERRAPYNMCFALRGAFHHRKLKFFRANDARGPEFVTNTEYKAFDAEHAIPELAKVARFIAENPCQPKAVIAPDAETEKYLAWLVSTGHVVAFTNGVYSPVEKFPKYGPQWQKKLGAAATGEGTKGTEGTEGTVAAGEPVIGEGTEGTVAAGEAPKMEEPVQAEEPPKEEPPKVEETGKAEEPPKVEEAPKVEEEPKAVVEEEVKQEEVKQDESAAQLAE